MIGVVQALARVDKTPGGEVRPLHIIHEIVNAALRVIQQQLQGVAQFAQIVGRDVGSHTHGNTRAAVEQQVGNLARHDRGFLQGVVVVGAKIHGVLVQVVQELLGKLGHAHFGITHGRGGVAVYGAEVALPVHQGIAHGKLLRHTHQRIVHGRVAVRVIFTDNVTDDARGFFVRTVIVVGKLILGEHDAPMYRLKTVARVRDGAPDDDRKGILQIRFAEFCFYAYLRLLHICHCGPRCCYFGAGRTSLPEYKGPAPWCIPILRVVRRKALKIRPLASRYVLWNVWKHRERAFPQVFSIKYPDPARPGRCAPP